MRIRWIDACKGIGIILVYYGHAVERFAYAGLESSLSQLVYLYSFHMPLFFILSGYMYLKSVNNHIVFLINRFKRIVSPILFFNVLFCFLVMAVTFVTVGHVDIYVLGKKLFNALLTGNYLFCALTWFLYCIMSVFVLHAVFNRALKNRKITASLIIIMGLFGHWLTSPAMASSQIVRSLGVWHFNEAFVAYTFFLVGIFIHSLEKDFTKYFNRDNYWFVALISIVLFYWTVGLNDGPFRRPQEVVIMALKSHGGLVFYLPAIAGSIAVICLARLLDRNKILETIGKNSIPYMALNGVFHIWLNFFLLKKVQLYVGFPKSHFSTFVIVGFITVGSIALVTPIVNLFSRYIPTLLTGASSIDKKE